MIHPVASGAIRAVQTQSLFSPPACRRERASHGRSLRQKQGPGADTIERAIERFNDNTSLRLGEVKARIGEGTCDNDAVLFGNTGFARDLVPRGFDTIPHVVNDLGGFGFR